ncbi:hypothetical protein F3Y22_tig00017701pilonHSYRG00001 [Hibiscus syriacus]|uniref:Uncharacterized protein n=1 Tax=Hibiscus syriacus TaxID=106335 RepID=A0A6A3C180_HIBSY|nr:uncharacterized protein LOC120208807 [Hibiscus syriacus]KAE8721002.1 hypothetical protein F3Y22_tig00017701pilonHSYRG00001 [Hibiscus syriacus]
MAGYGGGSGVGPVQYQMIRVLRAVRSVGDGVWSSRVGTGIEDEPVRELGGEDWRRRCFGWRRNWPCGFADEAVERWASASNLASLSLMAEQRLQGSLVKVSAFLFMQAKNTRVEEESEEGTKEKPRQLKMITSWLPLLCRASIGSDVPVLSVNERIELEKVLEDAIEKLDGEEQEQVLSLWLYHFTYCPSSDWPILRLAQPLCFVRPMVYHFSQAFYPRLIFFIRVCIIICSFLKRISSLKLI